VSADFDLVVVGGGINGAGIARDAQGRGLRVMLVEQDDLAQHTSSASTKLIHGGLRYLEHFQFGLVRKALKEREVLLRLAPHVVRPLRLVMPHDPSMRPPWLIRTGLFLYDHLARRERLPASAQVDLVAHPAGACLRGAFRTGFVFSDAWADDARLVVLNALDAHERGATVLTRMRCVGAERSARHWQVRLERRDGGDSAVTCRALVNAAGPWVTHLLEKQLRMRTAHGLRLVKGSHVVVPRLFEHDHGYVLQNADRRIVFALPYERDFTLIGTTEVEYAGDPAQAAIGTDEIGYLCQAVNRYFSRTIAPGDVVHAYAGVRPLLEDAAGTAARVTRGYRLELNTAGAPLLSVFGGKLTTYRRLAEQALARLLPVLAVAPAAPWTAGTRLPGGDLPDADFMRYCGTLRTRYPWLPEATAMRLACAYGARADAVLRHARSEAELGREILPGLFEAELDYLRQREWALTAEDILWRRTKLGLHVSAAQAAELARVMAAIPGSPPAAGP
jgi:glycerol-3-phosphate dehydrogenase